MKKFVFAAVCTFLGATAQAQVPATSIDATVPGPMMGAYQPAPSDMPLVLDAKVFIQHHLPTLNVNEVTEAYTQVVAGLNVKLVCSVSGEDGPATWQFVAFRSLDGRWHFHSAKRL